MAPETISHPQVTMFTPEQIVTEVLAGRVRVPSFQPAYRWQWEDVRRLFDSISKGYPIGSLLLWERQPAPAERIRLGALEIAGKMGSALYVIDGQQRITSLANALTAEGANDPRFALAYNLENQTFEKCPQNFAPHVVPLPVIFQLDRLLLWFASHPELDRGLLSRASQLATAIRRYPIPAYVVNQQDELVLREIFDRLNNYGRRLSRAEVFAALHGRTSEAGSNLRFSDLADAVSAATGFGRIDEDTVLRAYLARRGGDVARDIRHEFSNDFACDFPGENPDEAYHGAEAALIRAVRFLQNEACIPHFTFLPYRYILIVLTRFFAYHPKPARRNLTLLRRFCWRAVLAGSTVLRGWTHAMQGLATRITADDETGSVRRLLEAIGQPARSILDLNHFRTNTAATRTLLCGLWSLRPVSPVEGAPYGLDVITATLNDETRATNALKTFFPYAPATHRSWAANRAIVPEDVGDDTCIAFVQVTARFSASVKRMFLESHGLDEKMVAMMATGNAVGFLEARQEKLTQVLRDFLEKMIEAKFEDTPPLDELDMDDDDEGRDDVLDA